MYLKHALILNSGSISDLEIEMDFNNMGNPKPLILIGPNGTGKTNFLSLVADALIEIASLQFSDIAPQTPDGGHKYFRVLGGTTMRIGSNFELEALKFSDAEKHFHYVSKSGDIKKDAIQERLLPWSKYIDSPTKDREKRAYGNKKDIERIFYEECYVFFPSNRWEKPYWAIDHFDSEEIVFSDVFTRTLGKPILVTSTLPDLKPWLVDVIFDQMVDVAALRNSSPSEQKKLIDLALRQHTALSNFNKLLQTILELDNARLVRNMGATGSRKLQVYDANKPLLPSLESLSAGQASLLGIFGTILRYADRVPIGFPTNKMKGIVLIDEIDAHLHANLQYDILPKLIALFPKIQFIITAHSPLFPLGMEKKFGEDRILMIEMPEGKKITAERFGEFLDSFEMLKTTKTFEETIAKKIAEQSRPLILCEGETDPKYFKTAAELLGYNKLAKETDWDWVGTVVDGKAKDGGKDQLKKAKKLLQNNPLLLKTDTILLFDCDTNEQSFDKGLLHVQVLARNEENQKCNEGIENLLPESVFEDRFFTTKTRKKGANETITKELNKLKLCNYLCDKKKDSTDFEKFKIALDEINRVLGLEEKS